jgi:hypothetical protein
MIIKSKKLMRFSSLPVAVFSVGAVFLGGSSQASPVPYIVDITNLTGVLSGKTYQASFVYDDNTLKVLDFEFPFEGRTYTEADDPTAKVAFDGSTFLGLSYAVTGTPEFSFVLGINSIGEAYFSYDLNSPPPGPSGFGDTTYTFVPAPAAFPIVLFGLGFSRKLRKRVAIGKVNTKYYV